jgi:hypothetical protein
MSILLATCSVCATVLDNRDPKSPQVYFNEAGQIVCRLHHLIPAAHAAKEAYEAKRKWLRTSHLRELVVLRRTWKSLEEQVEAAKTTVPKPELLIAVVQPSPLSEPA